MNKIQVHTSGNIYIVSGRGPVNHPAWGPVHEVEVPELSDNQKYKWLPYDEEDPQGIGELQVVDIPLSIPERIQLWQFRAIMKLNNLWEPALQAAENLDEPNRTVVLEHMERGQHVYRNSPTLKQFQQALNITDEQADQMFIEASNLKL